MLLYPTIVTIFQAGIDKEFHAQEESSSDELKAMSDTIAQV